MASILRSTKFVRYFAGVARSIVFSSRETEGSLVPRNQCLCSSLVQPYGTSIANAKADQGLDKSIKRLDQDVRRSGRISRRDLEEVLEEIRQHRTATSSQSLLVIRCCGNLVPEELPEVRTALVQDIWKTLNNLNVPMDISHYNALLRVYLENEHPFSPTEFLADVEAKGLEPNRVTYQRLISRYCQEGDIDGATRILEFMREKQQPVNEYVFNALIMGHSQADDMESAHGILGVMKQAGLEPSADTYTTLLCGYGKKGDTETILKTMAECEGKEIYLLDKDILEVIYSMANNGHSDKVDKIIEKLRKSIGYNQDAFNLILRLTNKGHVDVAFRLLQSMNRNTTADGSPQDTGNFFIRQMVKAQIPIEDIIRVCGQLTESGMNARAIMIAIEAALSAGQPEQVLVLLKEGQKAGLELRQHYFWPVLVSMGKRGRPADVAEVLKQMSNEYNLIPSGETVRDYVIPNLKNMPTEALMNTLIGAGVSSGQAASSVAYSLLAKNNLKAAATLANQYRATYNPQLFRKNLVSALGNTKDVANFVKFVRLIHDSVDRMNKPPNQEEDQDQAASVDESNQEKVRNDRAEVVGMIVVDVVNYFKADRVQMLTQVLEGLVNEGLSISGRQAEIIQEKMGSQLTTEISEMLSKLTAGDLEPIHREPERRTSLLSQMSVEQVEKFIGQVEAKGENVNRLKRFLLGACFRAKDMAKTEQVIERLKKEGYTLTAGVYSQLADLYTHHGEIEKALATLKMLRETDPEFRLDNIKTIRLASSLMEKDRFEEAMGLLEANKKEAFNPEEHSFNYNAICWRLLNGFAEKGKAAELERLFDVLESGHYVEANNVVLGPLIKVHLVNDDLSKAMAAFEKITAKYRATPWKNDLACRLIQAEDATNLQKLTDLSTNVHGEVNSLYDLVFSFVECGRIRQARRILETPGLRVKPQRINHACERYRDEGKVEPLEGLIEATRDLHHIDRSDIYYHLLLSYEKEKEPAKALGLWTKMQEEDIAPTEAFLRTLAKLLKVHKMEVPFKLGDEKRESPTKKKVVQPKAETMASVTATTVAAAVGGSQSKTKVATEAPKTTTNSEFRMAIKNNQLEQAMALYNVEASKGQLTIMDQSKYMELLVREDQMKEATAVVQSMLKQKRYPLLNNFRFYLNKLASNGDVATIEEVAKGITADLKRQLSFDNRLCHAYIVANKVEEYLKGLETDLEAAKTPADLEQVGDKFPRGGAVGILEKQPEMAERFERMAERYAERGLLGPMNVLWMHYFVANDAAASDRIWDKYVKNSPRLMFQRVMHVARENGDEQLINRLVHVLDSAEVTAGAIGNAYSCQLDVMAAQRQFEGAHQRLPAMVTKVGIENINRTALLRIKEGVEASGGKFMFEIPAKKKVGDGSSSSSGSSSGSGSSSSSSSDDDRDTTKTRKERI